MTVGVREVRRAVVGEAVRVRPGVLAVVVVVAAVDLRVDAVAVQIDDLKQQIEDIKNSDSRSLTHQNQVIGQGGAPFRSSLTGR